MKLMYLCCRRIVFVCALAVLFSTTQTKAPVLAQAAGITSPAPGSSVNGAVPIIGTASIDTFQRYELSYKSEPSGDESYIYFDGNTREVFNGQLGVWHTDALSPGTYSLRMRVVKTDGNYSEHFVPNLSVNQQLEATATPTETPAEEPNTPTETPIPIDTATPVPQPTPAAVDVQQPNLGDTPVEDPTPTAELVALGGSTDSSAGGSSGGTMNNAATTLNNTQNTTVDPSTVSNFTQELGAALSLERLRERFMTGVRYTAGIFFIVVAIFVGKKLLEWTLSKAG